MKTSRLQIVAYVSVRIPGSSSIHEGGHLTGMATCGLARILGELDGEIEATELLQIQATGRVDGKINYTRLVIEDGGLIKGDVSPSTEPVLQKAAILANKTPDVTSVKNTNQDGNVRAKRLEADKAVL